MSTERFVKNSTTKKSLAERKEIKRDGCINDKKEIEDLKSEIRKLIENWLK